MMTDSWHALSEKEVLRKLRTTITGLSEREAQIRLRKYGENKLKEIHKIKPFTIFLQQFKSVLIYILLVAAFISGFMQHWLDFWIIFAIIFLNAILGFVQHYKAEKSIEKLKQLLIPEVKVIREGKLEKISATRLVQGDILVLEEGDRIMADSRLIESENLQTNEAVLTGESMPQDKSIGILEENTILADRTNMLYTGTTVVRGNATAVVTATGMSTEFGKIASSVQRIKPEKTPLQKKLDRFAKQLGIGIVILVFIIAIFGILFGLDRLEMILIAISLAVAAVPEGLPAVITIGLAITVQRMLKVNSLIRKLPAAETLGRVTVICTDKTGTITSEEMQVTDIFCNNRFFKTAELERKNANLEHEQELRMLLKTGCLCNNARLEVKETADGKKEYNVIGDPTERALVLVAKKFGLDKKELTEAEPRLKEFSFTSERKLMSIVRKSNKGAISYVKGAPDIILDKCAYELVNGKIVRLTSRRKAELLAFYEKMASHALRVLAFAFRQLPTYASIQFTQNIAESNLVFLGFQGMFDPPRQEVKEAIRRCNEAGIRVVMITGDAALTARAVSEQIGLHGSVMTGTELEKLNNDELKDALKNITIFARVKPQDKLRIIEAFKDKGEVVAVTGDGVNDAPALKRADIGVAMGIRGSDVARDVSDIVLLDDNFASIVKAVKEGRRVFDNIKKFTYYLLSSNFAEILIIFFALLIGSRFGWASLLPLLPIQILWINLISDGLVALPLSTEMVEAGVMRRKPEQLEILTKNTIILLVGIAMLIGFGTLFLFKSALPDVVKAQTIAFTTIVMFEEFNAFNFRSFKQPLFKLKRNYWLLIAVAGTLILQIIIVHTPFLQPLFRTTALSLREWLTIVAVSSSILIIGEAVKIKISKKKKI
jgi:Ca2+-transporting ATPase